jgi:hypothetical protein
MSPAYLCPLPPLISQFVKRGLVLGGRLRHTRLGGAGGGDGDGVLGDGG